MISVFETLRLLLWKNFIVRIRHPFRLLFKLTAVILICTALLIFRNIVAPLSGGVRNYKPFCVFSSEDKCPEALKYLKNRTLLYAPSNNNTAAVIDNLNFLFKEASALKNGQEIRKYFLKQINQQPFAGVLFNNDLKGNKIDIAIRLPQPSKTDKTKSWRTDTLYHPYYDIMRPKHITSDSSGDPDYYKTGFLTIQQALVYSIISVRKNITMKDLPLIELERYPYSHWTRDRFSRQAEIFVPLVLSFSFCVNFIILVRDLVNEEESKIKFLISFMGVPNWLNWVSWFIHSFFIFLIEAILIVMFTKTTWFTASPVFNELSGAVYFVFLLLYIVTNILLCFLISLLAPWIFLATVLAVMLSFMATYPATHVTQYYQNTKLAYKLAVCLIPQSALYLFHHIAISREQKEYATKWEDVFEIEPNDNFSIGHIMIMLIVDSVIYILLILYMQAVQPYDQLAMNGFSNWFSKNKKNFQNVFDDLPKPNTDLFEEDDDFDKKTVIEVKTLTRMLNNTIKVSNVNLKIYESQLVVLLGHSGSGKTTIINNIVGIDRPTSGVVNINGYDIRNNPHVKKIIGFCPEYTILFNELTVGENMYFFSQLRGLSHDEFATEFAESMHYLELESEAYEQVYKLSQTAKRQLCVAVAFCGGSEIIILDEPMSGMDMIMKQSVLQFLEVKSRDRVILLSTHNMMEADAVADKIAILSGGILKCFGSRSFLKRKFGADGYKLILTKLHGGCNQANITALLKQHIPHVRFVTESENLIEYNVLHTDSRKFHEALNDLETNMKNLNICSYTIKLITMEEVFMKVGYCSRTKSFATDEPDTNEENTTVDCGGSDLLSGVSLIANQYLAMLWKFAFIKRHQWYIVITQFMIPLVAVLVSEGITQTNKSDMPPLNLSLDLYDEPITLIGGEQSNPFYKLYRKLLPGDQHYTKNVRDHILKLRDSVDHRTMRQYVIAVDFAKNVTTAWFNGDIYHSPATSLQLVLNAVSKKYLGEEHNISFINHPVAITLDAKIDRLEEILLQMPFVKNLEIGVDLSLTMIIIYYCKEKKRKFKRQQLTSGLSAFVYWTSSFFVEILLFEFMLMIVSAVIVGLHGMTGKYLGLIYGITVLFGFTSLAVIFLLTVFIKNPGMAFAVVIALCLLFGILTSMIEAIVIKNQTTDRDKRFFLIFKLLTPYFLYGSTLNRISLEFKVERLCQSIEQGCIEESLTNINCRNITCSLATYCCEEKDKIVLYNMLLMLGYFLVAFTLLILIDGRVFRLLLTYWNKNREKRIAYDHEQDEIDKDVLEETLKIRGISIFEFPKRFELVLIDVCKLYKNVYVVRDISLCLEAGECFGILGATGCGKTILFQMITAVLYPSSGSIWVKGLNSIFNLKFTQNAIGYSSQDEIKLTSLTVKQTMKIFCLIRGIPYKKCDSVIENISQNLGFDQYCDKKVGQLDAGMKRVLSIAIAITGEPPIICIDEPTLGMDLPSKQRVWKVLQTLREKGKLIMFASSNMEECEILCTRMAIMVNGQFKCLGSIDYLKQKYSAGQYLTVKMKRNTPQHAFAAVDRYVQNNFKKAALTEVRHNLRFYEIRDEKMTWSRVFEIMEKAKYVLQIENYSVGDKTLEQVFLGFSRS